MTGKRLISIWTFSEENRKILDQPCIYMYGDISGFHAVVAHYPKSETSIVMLTNRDAIPYRKIALDLARIAIDLPVESLKPVELERNQKFCGKYFCSPHEYEFKVDEDSHLYLIAGGNEVKLVQTGPSTFFSTTALEEYEFSLSKEGAKLKIKRNGNSPLDSKKLS